MLLMRKVTIERFFWWRNDHCLIIASEKYYSEALTYNSKLDGCNFKKFCYSIPKCIRIKELNEWIDNGNAQKYSFPGATSKQLFQYLDIKLNNSMNTVLMNIGINDILNSILNVSRLILNLKYMVKNVLILELSTYLYLVWYIRRKLRSKLLKTFIRNC